MQQQYNIPSTKHLICQLIFSKLIKSLTSPQSQSLRPKQGTFQPAWIGCELRILSPGLCCIDQHPSPRSLYWFKLLCCMSATPPALSSSHRFRLRYYLPFLQQPLHQTIQIQSGLSSYVFSSGPSLFQLIDSNPIRWPSVNPLPMGSAGHSCSRMTFLPSKKRKSGSKKSRVILSPRL